ncbi:MAG: hypothetical protein JO295_03385 [Verrucomicrobia bacterium]|nr:hypothetical protein [Verrucomicrobiota bacterium]
MEYPNQYEALSQLPPLEHCCQDCGGKGGRAAMYADEWEVCPACLGAGYIPTDFGRSIVALIRHQERSLGVAG